MMNIDYDGEIQIILNVLDRCGLDYVVTHDENKINSCSINTSWCF